MAAFGGFKVISFDYRMPPDFRYPAAMDDAMAVWKAALKMQKPRNMAIFGTSTGGGMTLAMIRRHGFPPAILTSGTRDLFVSLTVLTHRKLRQAGLEAALQVYEGMAHAQYIFDPYAPETKEVFTEIARFLAAHLGK